MSELVSIAKITRPRLSGVASRERLFHLLDVGMKKAITWIAAPAGSGKTTLVASWLEHGRPAGSPLPGIWYQVDEGDGDLATFFYYMGLAAKKAAPKYKKSLPLLTPEYLQGIPTFTRRYFENLYSLLIRRGDPMWSPKKGQSDRAAPTTIVLDNYQDAPLQSGFHEMIAHAFDVIPEGVNVIVISRGAPPAQLSRLKANNKIDFIGWDKIRFTIEETQGMLDQKGCSLTDEALMVIQWKTDGWAAGLMMMMGSLRMSGFQPHSYRNTPHDIFDYFANEIFARIGMETRLFLLKTSFLPTMTVRMAERLTGVAQSHQILSGLSRGHCFTDRRPLSEPVFQYHPLFREFLQSKAKEEFSEGELSDTQRIAASLLADSGNVEDAAGLFRDAKDWEELAKLALSQAQTLFDAGRHEEALRHLATSAEIGRGINFIEYTRLLLGARFAFELGDEDEGLVLLRHGMALGAEQSYVTTSRWNNETMSRLCAKALEHGIETEYVRMLIRKRNLLPPADVGAYCNTPLQNCPCPIKIYTLGRFEIIKDDKPIEFSRKVQKKPLEMLKAIIALGGRDVSEEQLIDALWPDAEGDAAHSTFKSNLHRLRQLIGNNDALTIKEGRVTLDPRYCWVDAWAFQVILAEIEGTDRDRIRQLAEKGIGIYNGDFLVSDKGLSWAVSMRKRLKGWFIQLVRMSGQNHINSGEWEEAIKLYRKALEINDLEEEFYRALMLCYGKLGRRADVQTTYHRLGKLLASVLAVGPSPETKAAYKKAMGEVRDLP